MLPRRLQEFLRRRLPACEKPLLARLPPPVVTMHAAARKRSVVIESDLYHVEISNRGGWCEAGSSRNSPTITSRRARSIWSIADAAQAGRQLAVFPCAGRSAAGSRPPTTRSLKLLQRGKAPAPGAVLHAPAEITLVWSDGHLEVTKHLKFNESLHRRRADFGDLDGMPLRSSLAWTGGFGDATAYRAAVQTQVFTNAAGKLNTLAAKNLGKPGQTTVRATIPGTFDFAGIEDLYFAAAFLPPFTARMAILPKFR